jgi:hypothetical protein
MAKIPTYKSKTTVRSGFRAPQLKDATIPLLQGVNNLAQNHLDKVAATEGKESGFQEMEAGTTTIKQAEAKPNTIRGEAYKEGARASFVAKKKTEYESSLQTLYNENQYDLEAYNKGKDKIRNDLLADTPSSLQQAMTIDFDSTSAKFNRQIGTNQFVRVQQEELKIQTDRITTITNNIEEAILSGGDNVETLVAEATTILDSLYNKQKKIDVDTLSVYTDSLFGVILNAEIMAAFKATPNADKEAFIKMLENKGHKQFLKELKETYGDEIKAALPQFEIPTTISDKVLTGIVSDLNAEFREMVQSRESESIVAKERITNSITEALNDDVPIGEAVPIASIYAMAEENFWDEETIESVLNAHKQGELVQLYTKNHKTMSIDELTSQEDLLKVQLSLLKEDASTESGLKVLAINTALNTIEERKETLKNVIGNSNPYKVLEKDGIIDFDNITDTTHEDLKKRRIETANKLGVPVELIPLVDQNEIKNLTDGLASNDINQVDQTIELIKTLQLDNNISIVTELLEAEGVSTRANIIEIALELPQGAERSMLLEAEIRKDEIKTILSSKKDSSDASDVARKKDIADHINTLNITNLSDKAKAIEFYTTVINYQLANDVDFENARKKADEIYKRGFQPIELANRQSIIVPNSVVTNTEVVKKSIETVNLTINDPIGYNYQCPSGVTFSECETAFQNDVQVDREGTQLIFKSNTTDADLGTTGVTMSMETSPNEAGEVFIAPMIVEMDQSKNAEIVPSNKKAHGWDFAIPKSVTWKKEFKNENIVKNIPEWAKDVNPDDVPLDILQKPLDQTWNTDLKTRYEERDQYEKDIESTKQFYRAFATSSGFIDTGVDNITAYDPEEELVVAGILLKNGQSGSQWTEWELDYLSRFDDLDGLQVPAVKEYVINNWTKLQNDGGYAGKGNGARLSPAASLFLLIKEAERTL